MKKCAGTRRVRTIGVATIAAALMAAAAMLCASAMARQNSAASAQQAPAATATKPAGGSGSGASAKAAPGSASAPKTAGGRELVSKKDKQSYAIGMNVGHSLKAQPIELDPAIVAEGLRDTLSGAKPLLTEDEVKAILTELQGELRTKQEAKMQEMSGVNKKEGDAFLAANKSKEGVVALPSGLQYKILTKGTGPKPSAGDTVVCNYRGTLVNGKEFDSSYKRGQPATFPVSGVIKGWTEALQLMPVGSKWELYVPADLAYGDRGAGPDIGPGATLIFDVELISIQKK